MPDQPRSLRPKVSIAAALTFALAGCGPAAPAPGLGPAEVTALVGAPPAAAAPLARVCADCHSTAKTPPWNARLAFSYWFPGYALKVANFAEWPGYSAKRRGETLKAFADVMRDGSMPPWDYRLLHPEGALSHEEQAAILAWAEEALRREAAPASGTPGTPGLAPGTSR